MDTNTLNKHLEKKSKSDINKMIENISCLIKKWDDTYNIGEYKWHEENFDIKINKVNNDSSSEIIFDRKLSQHDCRRILINLFTKRYYSQILNKRTKDLLNKVELLEG